MDQEEPQSLDRDRCIEIGRSCACANLRMAARAVTRLYDDALRPTGLRSTQFGLLMAVRILGPMSVTRLAGAALMDRTTLTRNLSLLEKKALIRIEPGEDQRMREVSLTQEGHAALTEALPLWEKAQAQVVHGLGKDRMAHLLKDLSAVVSLTRNP
jgi:DNA-binding MarR family transcriptional regulator